MSEDTEELVAASLATFQKTGGPAFPADWKLPDGGIITCPGMTMRDWFAGQALAGICGDGIPGSHHQPVKTAEEAYAYADAMLAESGKAGAS